MDFKRKNKFRYITCLLKHKNVLKLNLVCCSGITTPCLQKITTRIRITPYKVRKAPYYKKELNRKGRQRQKEGRK